EREEAAAGGLPGGRQAERVQDRREDVHVADPLHGYARREEARGVEDQRDAERGVVREDPVRLLAVFAQALAVIAGEDDQGTAVLPAGEERLEDGTEQAVRVRHFAVIRRRGVARGE